MSSVIDAPIVQTKAPRAARAARTSKPRGISDLVKKTAGPRRIADVVRGRGKLPSPFRATKGADPELHIWSVDEGRILSAIPVLKRDKHNPIDLGAGIKLYADCTLCEFSFPPSDTADEMMDRMKDAFGRIQDHLGDKYRLLPIAAHTYLDAELEPSWGVDPKQIGCTPHVDVYREAVIAPSMFPDNLRTGSFHIHLGNADYAKKHGGHLLGYDSRHATVRLMDIFVGCGSVIFDMDETSATRRRIYGASGSFRMTCYGLEYRPLSPGPLSSQETTRLCLDLTDHVLEHVRAGTEQDVIKMVNAEEVQLAINTCDKTLAEKVLVKAGLPSNLFARVKATYDLADFNKNWGI